MISITAKDGASVRGVNIKSNSLAPRVSITASGKESVIKDMNLNLTNSVKIKIGDIIVYDNGLRYVFDNISPSASMSGYIMRNGIKINFSFGTRFEKETPKIEDILILPGNKFSLRNFKGVFENSELKPLNDFVCYLDNNDIYCQEISVIEDYNLTYYHKIIFSEEISKIKVVISDLVIKNAKLEKIRIEDWSLVHCENCIVKKIFINNASRIEYQGTCQKCQVFDSVCNLTGTLEYIFMRDDATSKLKLNSDLIVDIKDCCTLKINFTNPESKISGMVKDQSHLQSNLSEDKCDVIFKNS